jgi:hypothetical protein
VSFRLMEIISISERVENVVWRAQCYIFVNKFYISYPISRNSSNSCTTNSCINMPLKNNVDLWMVETLWLLLCGFKSSRPVILSTIPVCVHLPLHPQTHCVTQSTEVPGCIAVMHRGFSQVEGRLLFLNSASKPLIPWTKAFPERWVEAGVPGQGMGHARRDKEYQ